MLPIVIDPKALRVAVAGAGEGLSRRLTLLAQAGVTPSLVLDRAPQAEDFTNINLMFLTGFSEDVSREIARVARLAGVLINVEDRLALCDFYVPAQVRRGELLLTVSTGGRSPGLARALREDLERRFGPEWDEKLDEIAQLRALWRSQGNTLSQVSERTREFLDRKGWLA